MSPVECACGREVWTAAEQVTCSACESERRPAEDAFRAALAEHYAKPSSQSRFAQWGARVNAAWLKARGLRVVETP